VVLVTHMCPPIRPVDFLLCLYVCRVEACVVLWGGMMGNIHLTQETEWKTLRDEDGHFAATSQEVPGPA
jgi:hypothetical protein